MSLLSIDELQAGYGGRRVLHELKLGLGDGQILVVLGANGAGKTTLLRAISGTIPRSGTIMFDGKRIDQLSARSVVASGIAHVPRPCGT
jgi:branched-chain amino acid transport system ATP-binding protein